MILGLVGSKLAVAMPASRAPQPRARKEIVVPGAECRFPYALDTDWPVGAAGLEPLHIRIGIRQDSQPGGRDSNLRNLELKARPIDA